MAHRRIICLFLLLALVSLPAMGADKVSRVAFMVLRDYNGKPVRNASVVLHSVDKEGKQSKNGIELKTDQEGKASFDGVSYGTLRIQAIAPGLQTYGDDVQVNQPEQQVTIKMNRPKEQYSIYK